MEDTRLVGLLELRAEVGVGEALEPNVRQECGGQRARERQQVLAHKRRHPAVSEGVILRDLEELKLRHHLERRRRVGRAHHQDRQPPRVAALDGEAHLDVVPAVGLDRKAAAHQQRAVAPVRAVRGERLLARRDITRRARDEDLPRIVKVVRHARRAAVVVVEEVEARRQQPHHLAIDHRLVRPRFDHRHRPQVVGALDAVLREELHDAGLRAERLPVGVRRRAKRGRQLVPRRAAQLVELGRRPEERRVAGGGQLGEVRRAHRRRAAPALRQQLQRHRVGVAELRAAPHHGHKHRRRARALAVPALVERHREQLLAR